MTNLEAIRLLILDVDGTLTDGRIFIDAATGLESRSYDVHDGFAIRAFQKFGGTVAICSGKGGGSIEHRAKALGIEDIVQVSRDKLGDCQRLIDKLGFTWDQTAMIGDDIPDIPVMRACGWSAAPADARPEVLEAAAWIADEKGGYGAVRSAIERVMKVQNHWDGLLDFFGALPNDGKEA